MILRLQNLHLTYRSSSNVDVAILDNISLVVDKPQIIGVVGDSGSGKTQLCFALARLNELSGGTISSNEHTYTFENQVLDLNKPDQLLQFRAHHICYIFQEAFSYFNPALKLQDQIHGSSKEIEELLSELGLENKNSLLLQYPHQVSGGQLQRLAIIRCLLKKPHLIIADEIDSALDQHNTDLVFNLIYRLQQKNKFTLVWISHQLERIKKECDRIWCIEKGKLVYDGLAKNFNPKPALFPSITPKPGHDLMLSIKNVSKSFPISNAWFSTTKKEILKDIHLNVFKGETVGILGPSGIGKSTLGKIIAGLDSANQGEIIYSFLEKPFHIPSKKLIYLFQDAFSSINPMHTIRSVLTEAIEIGDKVYTIGQLLSFCHLELSVLELKADQISGGMRQRLALARAFAVNPTILILDESLNALDHTLKCQLLKVIHEYQETHGISIIHISHDLSMLQAICNRIYRLEAGTLHHLEKSGFN